MSKRRREPKKIGYGDAQGLKCPSCNCADFRTRKTEKRNGYVYRYRQCRHCGRTVHTHETQVDSGRKAPDSV